MSSTPQPDLVADAAHDVHQLHGLLVIEAGGRLVEQQDRRRQGDGPGDLHLALAAVGQHPRLALGDLLEAELRQHVSRPGARPPAGDAPATEAATSMFWSTVSSRNSFVVWKVRATPRRAMRWEGRRSSGTPSERHLSCRRLVHPRDEVQERGLAGAVRADESHDLAAAHLERHILHGGEPGESLGRVLHDQGHRRGSARPAADGLPAMPSPSPRRRPTSDGATRRGKSPSISRSPSRARRAPDHHDDDDGALHEKRQTRERRQLPLRGAQGRRRGNRVTSAMMLTRNVPTTAPVTLYSPPRTSMVSVRKSSVK